ncbi:PREDICTED: E3 ubiquitin-protein ligase dbl4-like [Camelina sativa]|uniref:RBR-type E3 ubiquitin transferase n=1 Tax=Camelina sativa TaxID=90675 RepID=A0ABM0WPY9_CAMSA|nr:PREDICTED: E3 ubiquitin-protein ligase dbl4-like [Camelina sativa]
MDNLLYEIKESLRDSDISRTAVEVMALIRGLSESFDLGIRNVVTYCDDYWIYQSLIGRGEPKNIDHLMEEAQSILENMSCSDAELIALDDVKFAFRLAREAIASQSSRSRSVDVNAKHGENCDICHEETNEERMFFTNKCLHRHCFSCVKKHVEVKLLSGIVPTCLDYGCKSELTLEICSKVLTSKLIEMWKKKMKEDSIPAAERIYCPYPSCSMLMSRTELSSEAEQSNVKSCVKCCGLFCIDCKVPSHTDLSCADYKKLNPDPLVDDLKLKSLANENLWRQCVKCRHLIELSYGCNHMNCRCGYEFCYQCGIEWKKDQNTCPSGCRGIGNGDDDDDDDDNDDDNDDDDDDDDHDDDDDYEKGMGNYYFDEDGVRWRNYEEFLDNEIQPRDSDGWMIIEFPSPEQFFIEEGNGDRN